jgi:hypothetical protein
MQVPAPAGIISHGVSTAGDIVMERDVAVPPLMQSIESQKVDASTDGRG